MSIKTAKQVFALTVIALLFISCQTSTFQSVNLAHLEKLCENATIEGRPCTLVHIYSDAPDYGWTDAADEGIACVDDAARAAIVYIQACERDHDPRHIPRIRGLLNFVLALQASDGAFYNFVHQDRTINRIGPTSKKSFTFWAARGYWALATGYAFFKNRDAAFAAQLRSAFLQSLPQLKIIMQNYGKYETIRNRAYPTWLLNRYAADATSEFLLGAAAFLTVEPESALLPYAQKLAEGVSLMQVTDDAAMQDAFYSWPDCWHAWGNSQIQALARFSAICANPVWLQQAANSGRRFLAKMLCANWLREYDFVAKRFVVYPLIAYDVRTTALSFLELYRRTGEETYAVLAGLSASALTGNNFDNKPLYDSATGRGYDGLDRKGINHNAGAESTIETLYTLMEIAQVPAAAAWLNARSLQPWSEAEWPAATDLQRVYESGQKKNPADLENEQS